MATLKEMSEDAKYEFDCSDMTITERINELVNSNMLTKWNKTQSNEKEYNSIKRKLVRITTANNKQIVKHLYPFVWITPNKSIHNISKQQRESFDIDYKLTIYHQKELYYTIFTASYSQIQTLHQTALDKHIYFPSHNFTSVYQNTMYFRNEALKEDMENEQKYMILDRKLQCKGPGKTLFKIREATQLDIEYLAETLCKIFNSPAFAIQNYIYNTFKAPNNNLIDNEQEALMNKYIVEGLELLLKHKAFLRLEEWRHHLLFRFKSYEKEPFLSVHELKSKYLKTKNINRKNTIFPKQIWGIKFHSIFVVFEANDNPLGSHWAIILEGRYYLLTIEYCKNKNDKESGFVLFKLVPNNIIGQRVCWYSQRLSTKRKEQEFFTKRWGTLRKSFLPSSEFGKEVTFKYICNLVKLCIEKSDYYFTTNNCQHLVRNIFGALDPKEGKFLNTKLETGGKTSIIPSMPSGLLLTETVMMEKFRNDTKDFDDDDDELKYQDERDEFEGIINGLGMELYTNYDEKEEEEEDEEYNSNNNNNSLSYLARNKIDGQQAGKSRSISIISMEENKEEEEEEEDNKLDDLNRDSTKLMMNEGQKPNELNMNAMELLRYWKIPKPYIDKIVIKLKDEGYDDPDDWIDLYDDEDILIEMGFTKLQCRKFKRKYSEWLKRKTLEYDV